LNQGVNLMMYGHTHFYERACTVRYGVCVKDKDARRDPQGLGGVLHVSVGTGGHAITSSGGIYEPWKVYAEENYG
jgi:hypothetical protein